MTTFGERYPLWAVPMIATFAITLAGLPSCGGPPTEGENSIYAAAQYGDVGALREMLDSGFDVDTPDADGMTLLHYAAGGNQVEVIEMLINDFGASATIKDSQGRTPLDVAQQVGNREAYNVLESES